jgi:PAS domain S-box-containing protein
MVTGLVSDEDRIRGIDVGVDDHFTKPFNRTELLARIKILLIENKENSLRKSEGRFRGLVEKAAVGVAEIVMNTGRFLMVNSRLCEMMGRTEEEMLNTTLQAITHREDLHLHEEKTQMMLAGQIGHYNLEKRYVRKDGGIVWEAMNMPSLPFISPKQIPGSLPPVCNP